MTTHLYEFQPPSNIKAIRTNIMHRIKQQKDDRQSMSPTTSLPYRHLDNGLPSPPIESCSFEEKEPKLPTEMVMTALLTLSSNDSIQSPPSPVLSCSKSSPASSVMTDTEAIRLKIKSLQEEKHRLFQVMKGLISKPKEPMLSPSTSTTSSHSTVPPTSKHGDNPIKNHRPSSIRSRSISHNDYRPASRYGNYHYDQRRRFYGGYEHRGYVYTNNNTLNTHQGRPYSSPSSSNANTYMSRRIPYLPSRSPIRPIYRPRSDRHIPRF